MAKKKSLLEQMRGNPHNNWRIADVQRLCDNHGVMCEPPSGGSHYKVYSDYLHSILTIPANRPIKAVYIKMVVSYIQEHTEAKRSDIFEELNKGESNE